MFCFIFQIEIFIPRFACIRGASQHRSQPGAFVPQYCISQHRSRASTAQYSLKRVYRPKKLSLALGFMWSLLFLFHARVPHAVPAAVPVRLHSALSTQGDQLQNRGAFDFLLFVCVICLSAAVVPRQNSPRSELQQPAARVIDRLAAQDAPCGNSYDKCPLDFDEPVYLNSYDKCPLDFFIRLTVGKCLKDCRDEMQKAGLSWVHDSGAKVFVRPQQWSAVMFALSKKDIRLKNHHVIVAQEFGDCLEQTIQDCRSKKRPKLKWRIELDWQNWHTDPWRENRLAELQANHSTELQENHDMASPSVDRFRVVCEDELFEAEITDALKSRLESTFFGPAFGEGSAQLFGRDSDRDAINSTELDPSDWPLLSNSAWQRDRVPQGYLDPSDPAQRVTFDADPWESWAQWWAQQVPEAPPPPPPPPPRLAAETLSAYAGAGGEARDCIKLEVVAHVNCDSKYSFTETCKRAEPEVEDKMWRKYLYRKFVGNLWDTAQESEDCDVRHPRSLARLADSRDEGCRMLEDPYMYRQRIARLRAERLRRKAISESKSD